MFGYIDNLLFIIYFKNKAVLDSLFNFQASYIYIDIWEIQFFNQNIRKSV